MIYEMAHLTIDPARATDFEAAVADCVALFRAAQGCRSMRLERQIEERGHYLLRIGWESVEDHMVTFRASPAFQEWRTRVGGYFAAPPVVVHHDMAVAGF